MNKAIETKKVEVTKVAEKFSNSVSSVVVNYSGLTVSEMTKLRSELREAGVEMTVYKNNISTRASQEAGYPELGENFVGPTAVAFSNDDVVAPARILSKFAKAHEALEIKAGTMEDKVISLEEVNELGNLPSRDGLLSMVLSVLQAPIRDFALTVKAVEEQKASEEN